MFSKQHFPNIVDEDANPFRKKRLNVACTTIRYCSYRGVRFTDIDYRRHHKFLPQDTSKHGSTLV